MFMAAASNPVEAEVSLATVLCWDFQLASFVIMTAADNRRDERVL
jgi:hypothetical protein